MKKILFLLIIFSITNTGFTQKIDGQWRGYFDSKGDIVADEDATEYVLELEIKGSSVSGYSYTYFQNRRYYVICSLDGNYDKKSNYIQVSEVSRLKGLTPPGWQDCLQTHFLTYEKEGQTEKLIGRWRAASGQLTDCGFGTTTLSKRTLSNDLASYNKSQNRTPLSASKPPDKFPDFSDHNKKKPPVVKSTPQQKLPLNNSPLPVRPSAPVKKDSSKNNPPEIINEPNAPIIPDINFEKRDNNVLRTIKITGETFKVDLYDNGVIDGDSISLFYNGKLLLSHQRLSYKPITLFLNANTNREINELTMYAENLGEIPPNTALMVVTDGDNRYEVRISSDLKRSGVIRFIH